MQTAKKEVQRILQAIPDSATFEDIQYHIYVREKIAKGIKELKAGRVLSQETVEKRMAKWLAR